MSDGTEQYVQDLRMRGVSRRFRFAVVGLVGVGIAGGVVEAETMSSPGTPSVFVPMAPERVFDSRDGAGGPAVPLADTMTLSLNGVAGIPDGATAVSLNVTVDNATVGGYLSVTPAGQSSTVSSVNFAADQVVANQITVALNAAGDISITNAHGTVDVIVDVFGYYAAAEGTGADGAKGDTGATGDPGAPGTPGADGVDGIDGIDGIDGVDGNIGVTSKTVMTGSANTTTMTSSSTGEPSIAAVLPLNGALAASGTYTLSGGGIDDGQTPYIQTLPTDFTLTDLSIKILHKAATNYGASVISIKAQLYASAGGSMSPVVGAECTATPTLTGMQWFNNASGCQVNGLSIPLPAGTRAVMIVSIRSVGGQLANSVPAQLSTSIAGIAT